MSSSRRWLMVAALAVTTLAASCRGSSSVDDPGREGAVTAVRAPCPVDALDSTTDRTEVLLWYQLSGNPADTLTRMVDEYNASQSKVHVRAERQGDSYDELLRKYEQGIPTGELPDLIVAEDTATRFLIDSGTVIPAQSCFDADGLSTDAFVPAAVNHYTVDGVMWPGSVSVSDLLTYYNKNHLRRAGLDPERPPRTLDDVRRMAEAIKAAGVTDTPVVLLLDSWLVETQLTGSRHTLVDNDNGYGSGETTAATFDDAQTTSVFDWIQSMEAAGLLLPVPVTDGARGHYLAMATQKASITLETSTVATTVQDVIAGGTPVVTGDGGSIDTSGLDIGASPVVGVDAPGKAQIGGNAFWITTAGTDAQKAGAWDLLKWWNQEPQQVQWHIEGSYLPFLQSAAADPEVQRFWDSTLAGGFLHTAYDEFTQSVDPDFTGALIGPYDKFRQSMRDALASVAFEGTDPAAAIATAERETNQALTDYNDSNF